MESGQDVTVGGNPVSELPRERIEGLHVQSNPLVHGVGLSRADRQHRAGDFPFVS